MRAFCRCAILLRVPTLRRFNLMTQSHDGYYEALWPRSPRQVQRKALAPRLSTLQGKTVAQLWDHVFRGDEVFEFLEEGLSARYPGVKFVSWREFGNTHG